MSELLTMEVEEIEANELKKRKSRTPRKAKNDTDLASKSRLLKGIILSATKPSYTLQRGRGTSNTEFESLRWLNRNRLSCLLRKLMRRHNWDEASGVLSVLLNGTCKERSVSKNRTKYLATMELLMHNKDKSINPKRFRHVFETWMKKIGMTRDWQTKDRFFVQLEFILFCLTHGNTEDARQAVTCLMQEREFRTDPISNLVVGLTFCQEWYTAIQKEFPKINFDGSYTPNQSEMLESRFDMSVENSKGYVADEVEEANYPIRRDSDTSVKIDREIGFEEVVDQHRQVSMDADQQRRTPHQIYEPRGFYVSAETDGCEEPSFSGHVSIFYAHDLEPWLLSLRFLNSTKNLNEFLYVQKKIHNDSYKGALKYLRLALNSTPLMYEALFPLVQMLLIGDQVKVALDEVEKFVTSSDTALPRRLKASLLEHFDSNNHVNLSTYFEDALKKDPTCIHSLTKLLSMHRNGDYSAERLLEMIALHLDATYAECSTWKEFASCFLKLSQCEEDRMSVCLNGNDGELMQRHSNHFSRNPGIFANGLLGKDWRFRGRWWLTRHFSQNVLVSEIAAGDLELIAYKAASASHLYGRDFEYVVKAFNCLGKDRNRDMLSFLQIHMQNSVGFYFNFKKKNH